MTHRIIGWEAVFRCCLPVRKINGLPDCLTLYSDTLLQVTMSLAIRLSHKWGKVFNALFLPLLFTFAKQDGFNAFRTLRVVYLAYSLHDLIVNPKSQTL